MRAEEKSCTKEVAGRVRKFRSMIVSPGTMRAKSSGTSLYHRTTTDLLRPSSILRVTHGKRTRTERVGGGVSDEGVAVENDCVVYLEPSGGR